MPPEVRHSAVRAYISRLVDLSRLRTTCRSIEFVRDEQLALVLHELGGYPFRTSISEALSICGDEFDIQVEDANRLANFLLERSALLEEISGFMDIVVGECSVEPEVESAPSGKFLEQLVRTAALATLAIARLGGGENTFLATTLAPQSQPKLSFRIRVTLAERHDGSIFEPAGPLSISLPVHTSTDSYLRALNLPALLGRGSSDALIDSCIAFAVRDEAEPAERAAMLSGSIDVGEDFVQTASRLGFLHESSKMQRLLRTCADILVGRNLAKSHHLRSGRGANDPQRMRGEWGAWRHDLDDEFHLHYWRRGSAVELANVVVHNDFDITY
jgi:hypothetical protein